MHSNYSLLSNEELTQKLWIENRVSSPIVSELIKRLETKTFDEINYSEDEPCPVCDAELTINVEDGILSLAERSQ